jgi:hypothetical protein
MCVQGRMCTIMKKQGPSLAYLEQVRQHMSRLPAIEPNTRTLIVCGYPNVGKSSFMNSALLPPSTVLCPSAKLEHVTSCFLQITISRHCDVTCFAGRMPFWAPCHAGKGVFSVVCCIGDMEHACLAFMNACPSAEVTRADVDVQPYAFTTKSLFVGHMDYRYLRWQVIDTPGILDRPLEERNTIEMQVSLPDPCASQARMLTPTMPRGFSHGMCKPRMLPRRQPASTKFASVFHGSASVKMLGRDWVLWQ